MSTVQIVMLVLGVGVVQGLYLILTELHRISDSLRRGEDQRAYIEELLQDIRNGGRY